MYKKVCCSCKVVLLPIAYYLFIYFFFAVLDTAAFIIAQSPHSLFHLSGCRF